MNPAIYNCSLASTSAEIYFVFKAASRVSRTRTPWRWGAAKDRRKLKGTKQRYLQHFIDKSIILLYSRVR
jgi:hypothetical protein